MNTIMKKSLFSCVLLAISISSYSQDNFENSNIEFNSKDRYSFLMSEQIDNSGLHLEFDAGYAPLGIWSVKETTGTEVKELKANYTVAANIALVYQTAGEFYIGGGTGVHMQQLSWEDGGKPYSKSYGIPLYMRIGAGRGYQGAKKVSFYMNGDIGLLVGTGDLKTSFMLDAQAGIYYGTTKIGIGFISTKPNPDAYFEKEISKGHNVAFGLFMGFRIF